MRAIGRCAIKVDVAAEKCVSTLLDLIQTKVNYVVQEAIVVIKVRTWRSGFQSENMSHVYWCTSKNVEKINVCCRRFPLQDFPEMNAIYIHSALFPTS